MAAILAAGSTGCAITIEPPAPVEKIAYGMEGVENLPAGLPQALDALEADAALRDLLGEEFVKLYLAVKRHEIKKAADHGADATSAGFLDRVEPFEVDEYFEFL